MTKAFADLPIDEVLPRICETMRDGNRLVLAAPPGAGKTTRVPLALAGLLAMPAVIEGRILLLEPRRIAARLAARQMARSLGERVGETVGLTTRVDRNVSDKTRVEVITDGLFTRRLLSDPELAGVGAVIFDEFHERRLNMDLGLALALDAQNVVREDLRLIIMSATLDTSRVAQALDAPVIESEGRQFPVETIYLGRSQDRIEDRMVAAVRKALREQDGSILAFLPGAGEIRRTAERLQDLPANITLAPLYGALSPADQDKAVTPAPEGERKVVLATDLAESSLTIEGVRIVIDSGLSRIAEDHAGGLGQKLVTVKASLASVDQRQGRAGRTSPGVCYRLWDEAATRGLNRAPTPEILTSDMAGLVMAMWEWGERSVHNLIWLDAPPGGRVQTAVQQLLAMGALDTSTGRLSPLGKEMSRLPLAPRLAALVAGAPTPEERALAAEIAALSSERGMGGSSLDLRDRLAGFRKDGSARARTLKAQAKSWGKGHAPGGDLAHLLARAWPDQIARRRPGQTGVYLMASGRAANVPDTDALAKSEWLVIADLGGSAKDARIALALPITESIALQYGDPQTEEVARFDPDSGRVTARRTKSLGAITVSETPLPKPPAALTAEAILEAVAERGFDVIGAEQGVQETLVRLALLEGAGLVPAGQPTVETLQHQAGEWLRPLLMRAGGVPQAQKVREALLQSFDWQVQEALRQDAPLKLDLPSGQSARVDYLDPRAPLVSARAQAFYGLTEHPRLGKGRVPVTIEMLSPGMKPVATTQDLAGFWGAGYKDMAKDMRGRYPKHDWPDDPAAARAHVGHTKKRLDRDR